ncbi:hypothetical protein D3C81_2080380 [compost metagenome]
MGYPLPVIAGRIIYQQKLFTLLIYGNKGAVVSNLLIQCQNIPRCYCISGNSLLNINDRQLGETVSSLAERIGVIDH